MSTDPHQRIHVLHVDDEPDFADLAKTFLERDDDRFTVETATSAEEGLNIVSDRPPDCVISDYNMPGKNGLEFLEAVQKEYPDLPFILFTGKGSEAVASDAISAGVTDYLQKGSGTDQYKLLANRIRNAVHARRETQRADRQEQLMRLSEFAGDTGGFELDVDSGELLLTDGTRRLIGLSDDTCLTQEEAIEFFHPGDRAAVRQTITRAAESGEQTRGTWRLQTSNGDERLVDVRIVPVTESGDVTTLRGAIHDVTERRERREELEQIETLFQHTQDSLFLIDVSEEFTLERVNPAYERTTGQSTDELKGRTPREILGEQQGATVARRYRNCVEHREPLEYTEQLRFDGNEMQWETKIAPVVLNGSVEYIVGATRDVTAREERQRELSRLKQAIDDANVSITLADASQQDDPLVYVNSAFEEMTGYLPEQALGRNCRFLQGEDTDSEKVAALRDAIDDEESISVELRNYRKDGTEFWNRLTVTPIYDDTDELVRYLGTQEDITERKERERDLERTQDLLSEMEELAGIGAWKYDADTGDVTNTVGARRIYGVDPKSSLSLDEAFEFFHSEDRERLRTRFDACLETGEPYEMDARITTTEGARRWVAVRGERVDTPESGHVVRGYIQDVTEEKRRKQQLTELNDASKDLLTAETQNEVAEIGVRAAKDILGLQANAVHLCEAGDTLTSVAQTDALTSVLNEAPTLPVADSIAGRVYQRGEPTVVEDARQDPDVHNPETDLRGHVYLPLADHGVLIAGSEERAAFDQQQLAVGELLAGNLTAALDRIEREQTVSRKQRQLSLFFSESPLGAVQ
ncbi:MAG: PAS domain S-box protein [Halobellus sp.]|uniref:PAS domain S-box protein n=1 Tax=Halobellus sp. TaxID=1979212 RepID=UPI0035D404E2